MTPPPEGEARALRTEILLPPSGEVAEGRSILLPPPGEVAEGR